MNRPRFYIIAASSLFVASCAQNWSPEQKARLSTVSVPPPVIAADAYKQPVGKQSQSGAAPAMVVPGGFAAGAAGGALGQLVVEGIGAIQQNMYERENATAIANAPKTLPTNLSHRIHHIVTAKLRSNSFLKGKIEDKSSNRLVINLDSYRYMRTGKFQGKILMTPCLSGSYELVGADGKKLLSQRFAAVALLPNRPLEDYANNRHVAVEAFDSAIENLASQISTEIDRKAGA